MAAPAIELKNISKSFGPVQANNNISLTVNSGTIHGIVGENGAGKSTLMSILYGFYKADSGDIYIRSTKTSIPDSQAAISAGIGMVFQHFKLVENFTVLENVILGAEDGALLKGSLSKARTQLQELSTEYELDVDPDAIIENLSVGLQQRVEILKALYRQANILILDEPTGVLTPAEADHLFRILKNLRDQGKTIILITHKLREIMDATDTVSVMRSGEMTATIKTNQTSPEELAELMVGHKVSDVKRQSAPDLAKAVCVIKNLQKPKPTAFAVKLEDISIKANAGEILAIAGIAGNGQDEIMAALSGEWRPASADVITLDGQDISHLGPAARRRVGLGVVPEERNGHAAIPSMNLSDNALLTNHSLGKTTQHGLINGAATKLIAADVIKRFDVRVPSDDPIAASLSGGNLQKFVVGREIIKSPRLLVVAQPTWGVDVGAAVSIRESMLELAASGSAIIMISQDLEEVFAIAHKIAVLHGGRLSGVMQASEVTAEQIGVLMGGGADRRGARA